MSDPLRTETSREPQPTSRAEREAKIEQLLLAGLDHYFAARYDTAINVWTRALFLDRSHARARAYIERARSAQAECQRESESLLHDGAEAVRRGDHVEARRLVTAAIDRGGAADDVSALLERVERLESGVAPLVFSPEADAAPRLVLEPVPPQRRSIAERVTIAGLALVTLVAIVFAVVVTRQEWEPLVERTLSRRGSRPAPQAQTPGRDTTPPVPRRAESALARARSLVSGGKLRDALPLLESVRATDPERQDADRLRAEIQRQLIAIGPLPLPAALPSVPVSAP